MGGRGPARDSAAILYPAECGEGGAGRRAVWEHIEEVLAPDMGSREGFLQKIASKLSSERAARINQAKVEVGRRHDFPGRSTSRCKDGGKSSTVEILTRVSLPEYPWEIA